MPTISGTRIPPAIDHLGHAASDNIDNKAMPRFQGNDRVPVEANLNPSKLVQNLETSASGNTKAGSESKQLLEHLADTHGGWNVAAGIHQGGLGGAAGGADPNRHATLSTGHHVQFNANSEIQKITGPGFSKPGPGTSQPSKTESSLDSLKQTYGLNDKQAMQVHRLPGGESESAAAERVLSGKNPDQNDRAGARHKRA